MAFACLFISSLDSITDYLDSKRHREDPPGKEVKLQASSPLLASGRLFQPQPRLTSLPAMHPVLDLSLNLSHSDEAGLWSWENGLKNSTQARSQEML